MERDHADGTGGHRHPLLAGMTAMVAEVGSGGSTIADVVRLARSVVGGA